LIEILENPHRETGGGAGPLVANLMAERGVSTLIAQNFGMNIKASLDEKGVNHFEFSGQIGDAVKSVLNQR
jgi:predicted Fe-Mo cluster-binding NifX family protein